MKTNCESEAVSHCSSKMVDVDAYAHCWEHRTAICIRGGRAISRNTIGECDEMVEKEQICIDIEGSMQCINVSYPVVVCYY